MHCLAEGLKTVRARTLIILCVLAALRPPALDSQAVYGSLSGRITDSSGLPYAGASVKAVSMEKGTVVNTRSEVTGDFIVSHLLPDSYDLEIEGGNANPVKIPQVSVSADEDTRIDIQLGAQASFKPAEEHRRAEVSMLFSDEEIHRLPLFNLDFTRLETFVPGSDRAFPVMITTPFPISQFQFANERTIADPRQDLQASTTFDLNAQHFSGTSFELDGTEVPLTARGTIVLSPTLESIREMKVTTQGFGLDFGQALAGVVVAHSRSGTNNWHGGLFEFRRSGWGQASTPTLPTFQFVFAPPGPGPGSFLPPKRNEFGGSIGGPLLVKRFFVFGDYQGTRRSLPATQTLSVPTKLFRDTCLQGFDCNLSEYGPPFLPGPIIPANQVSLQAIRLLEMLPAPNIGPAGAIVDNFRAAGKETFDDDAFDVRADLNLSQATKLFTRYSFADFRDHADAAFGRIIGGPGLSPDGFAGDALNRSQSLAIGFDHSLGGTLSLDVRFGWSQYHKNILPMGFNTKPAEDVGIPGLNFGRLSSAMPEFEIFGFDFQPGNGGSIMLGYGPTVNQCMCPLLESGRQLQFVNNWTTLIGKHVFKWGVDVRRLDSQELSGLSIENEFVPRFPPGFGFFSPRPELIFIGFISGNGLGDFALGAVNTFDRTVRLGEIPGSGLDPTPREHQSRAFFYAQDIYRVSSRLSLTYGLRWEIYFPPSFSKGGAAWPDLSTGLAGISGFGTTNLEGNVRAGLRNLAPLIGVAYAPTSRMKISAAYRRSFGVGFNGLILGNQPTLNPPLVTLQTVGLGFDPVTGNSPAFTFSQGPPPVPLPQISSSGQYALPAQASINLFPPVMRLPTVDSWTFAIGTSIARLMTLDATYVGNKGTHVFFSRDVSYNLNQPSVRGDPFAPDFRPPFPDLGFVNYFGADASNSYNALQVQAQHRFTAGYLFRVSYTLAKGMDYSSDYYNIDPRANYGPYDFDRTHVLRVVTLVEVPFGHGKRLFSDANRLVDRLVSGWSLAGTSIWSSGLPFSPFCQQCANSTGRPRKVGEVHITGDRNGYFTTAGDPGLSSPGQVSGPWQAPLDASDPGVGRNSLRGPGFFQADLSIAKTIPITETRGLEFRADFYNLFNNVNLGLPFACVDCLDPPIIVNFAPGAIQRQTEFAVKLRF